MAVGPEINMKTFKEFISEHRNVAYRNVNELAYSTSSLDKGDALIHPGLTDEHLAHIQKTHDNSAVKHYAHVHPKATKEQIKAYLDEPTASVARARDFINHPHAPKHPLIDKAIEHKKNEEAEIKRKAAEWDKVPAEEKQARAHRAIQKSYYSGRSGSYTGD